MALSERELRLLAEMEQALSADDPALVSTLSGTSRHRGPGAAIGAATLIIGIATLFTGLISAQTIVGVVGFILALIGVILLINAISNQISASKMGPTGARGPKSGRGKGFGKGFTKGFEDRWDQRGNGQ